jgi:hypothetical protein
MTQERKCFVSPQDISAVRLQCSQCKAAVIIPVEKLQKGGGFVAELSRDCPYCRNPSGLNLETRELAELTDFNILLGKLSEILKGRGVEFSLQVECAE